MLHGMFYLIGVVFLIGYAGHEFYISWFTNLIPLWNSVLEVGVVMGLWSVIILFHLFFVKLGNAEDAALGEALEREYARAEHESTYTERYQRLTDTEYDTEPDHEDKPKRNHGVR
jgi:hypothetical protein